METKIKRRSFLRTCAGSVAGAGLLFPAVKANTLQKIAMLPDENSESPELTPEYRILGRTGLKVSTVSYGAMRTRDAAVIHRALDMGMNYIDTAHCYMDGYNEIVVGKVLKTRRKETFIATKVHNNAVEKMMASIEASLKSLQTDYIDVIQLHGMNTIDEIQDERAKEALLKMKKQGKARFIGFTTHRNQSELLREAIKMDFYDMILVAYNFESGEELGEVIKDAAKKGIGIVAMKTQAGGYKDHSMGDLSPHQAALKWVLQNPGVANTIPSMTTYGQLEENVKVMGTKMGWHDRKTLHLYGKAIDRKLCRMCDTCKGQCPKQVDVLDVNRSLMYSEGYQDHDLAMRTYNQIHPSHRPTVCSDCDKCEVKCIHGLDVKAKMIQALKVFA